ncbi:MAG: fatty acyl-CoA synthetase [Caulobacterales bacterium]
MTKDQKSPDVIAARSNSIAAAFSRAARKHRDRVALEFAGRVWTFLEIDAAAGRLAHWLSLSGLQPGDRLLAYGKNSAAYLIAWLACCRGGFVHVPLNYALTATEAVYIKTACSARLVLFDESLGKTIAEAPPASDELGRWSFAQAEAAALSSDHDPLFLNPNVAESSLAQLLYTSGTTGAPKGAMMTHGAFLSEYAACTIACAYAPDDIALAALPLYHSAQMHAFTMPQMLTGARTRLLEAPVAETVLRLVEELKISSFFAPPTVWINLLRQQERDRRDLSSLRKIYYGAAIMPEPILRELAATLPGARLYNCYGQSEIGPVATVLGPDEHADRPTSAGRPLPSVETRVVNPDMSDAAVGQPGEIVHRSPQLMVGYWGSPGETDAAFAGGWFHSGDVGVMDAEGFLYVVDRLKDVINTGGVLVASREVEDALLRHPAVSEAAVIALPDHIWGEAISAVVVLRDGRAVSSEELIEFARPSLAAFKLPKRVFFAPNLPKNTAGKVLKRELRNNLAQEQSAPAEQNQ